MTDTKWVNGVGYLECQFTPDISVVFLMGSSHYDITATMFGREYNERIQSSRPINEETGKELAISFTLGQLVMLAAELTDAVVAMRQLFKG